jgi:molybdopterin converting factor subunit 1
MRPALIHLDGTNGPTLPVRVRYFALLREQAGRSDEALDTHARTPRELYEELCARYPFTLGPDVLQVAVNSEFCAWERPLQADDTVVFIPPVAGG